MCAPALFYSLSPPHSIVGQLIIFQFFSAAYVLNLHLLLLWNNFTYNFFYVFIFLIIKLLYFYFYLYIFPFSSIHFYSVPFFIFHPGSFCCLADLHLYWFPCFFIFPFLPHNRNAQTHAGEYYDSPGVRGYRAVSFGNAISFLYIWNLSFTAVTYIYLYIAYLFLNSSRSICNKFLCLLLYFTLSFSVMYWFSALKRTLIQMVCIYVQLYCTNVL